jgi:DNA-binding beta-propeller fold protein YncE
VNTAGGIARIDPTTNTVTATVPIAGGPLGDPAVVGGNVWVPVIRQNRVAIVDPATNTPAGSVKVGTGPFVVTEIAGDAWIPSWKGRDVYRVRP